MICDWVIKFLYYGYILEQADFLPTFSFFFRKSNYKMTKNFTISIINLDEIFFSYSEWKIYSNQYSMIYP